MVCFCFLTSPIDFIVFIGDKSFSGFPIYFMQFLLIVKKCF